VCGVPAWNDLRTVDELRGAADVRAVHWAAVVAYEFKVDPNALYGAARNRADAPLS